MLRTFLMIGFGVALIAWGAASFAELSSSANRGDIVNQPVAPVLDRVEELTTGCPRRPTMRIAATGGSGVAIRSDCADEACSGGAIVEGALVTVAARGEAACLGWTLVEIGFAGGAVPASGSALQQTWVRDAYLELVSDSEADGASE